jgi:hypothetical protein
LLIIRARACSAKPLIGRNQLVELFICVGRFKENQNGRCAMGIALEVNFALWLMIGCGLAEYLT